MNLSPRLLQQQINEKNRELNIANKQLRDLISEKNNFSEIIAHDLQHPLVAITMLSKMLVQREITEPIRTTEVCSMIHDAAMEMVGLIRNYVDSNRYETNGFTTSITKLNLQEIIKRAIFRYTEMAAKKNITIHFRTGKTHYIETDIFCLNQIIENLLSNAIKYTPHHKNVYVKVNRLGKTIIIEIRDEGVGIKKNEMPLLFKKYQKLSSHPTAGEFSTGLGLSIVKFLADKIGAVIKVDTEWKKGSAFQLVLNTSIAGKSD